ncbi:MAG TPA: D-alanyl-D-alanine carboxypeptidase/D-alanyl-D-alanine-endopeptidase [Acidobacteriaceae bacterium]|nr:D-alanyl-D-alanine carboxypeptidase/D-alanyl-D-alanine-endopeptidase [Acidobacteriaceae bacterium]
MVVLVLPLTGLAAHRRHRARHRRTGSLSHQIETFLAAPAAAQAHWGISITTLNGRLVYEKNDAQLFAPASNAKLLTTSTALALFGPNTTIETRVLASSAPDSQGTIHGDVTLVGAGDLSMSGRTYPYSGQTEPPNPPLSALEALADQLQQHGVKRVQGNIIGDDTAFPQESYGSGWAWDDLVWDYGAPISALTVNDNIVYLDVMPGSQAGDPVTFTWDPDVTGSFYTIENDTHTSVAGSQPSLGLDRPLGSRQIRLFGTLPAGGNPSHIALAVIDPAQFAAVAFRQILQSRGISVTGTATAHHRPSVDTAIYEQSVMRPLALPPATQSTVTQSNGAAQIAPAVPGGAVVLASRTSAPLLQDITVTNKVSQNLHAETWLRLLGQHFGEDGSIEEGARVVRAQMLRAGVQPQDFFFYDGSGLSPDDRITPRAITTLLRYIAEQPWGDEFRSTLPIGGIDGTLSDRFLHGPLHGHVSAKTGTLDEVNALSGYVTSKNGRTLVFSVLCNGHMPEAKGITKTIDAIVTAAAESDSVR